MEPNKSVPTYFISNRLNNPWRLPFSNGFPWIIGNTLSNDFKNSIILSILLILPLIQSLVRVSSVSL